ncbi:MAG: hypothetical protein B6D47_00590 [Rhodocyclaceae bacterium UTPRO2]|nr:MAG: hypothetical protein B6D47_00590 [Rhodocyclaceae bacterium UTPRO2]
MNKVVRGIRFYKSLKTSDPEIAQELFQKEIARLTSVHASEEWRSFVLSMVDSKSSWLHTTLERLRRRGRASGKGCSLTIGQFAQLVIEADGACQVSGIHFSNDIPVGSKRAPFSMSIDRIDSSRGYHFDNCRIVCLAVNLAMNNWGAAVMARIGKAMLLKELNGEEKVALLRDSKGKEVMRCIT